MALEMDSSYVETCSFFYKLFGLGKVIYLFEPEYPHFYSGDSYPYSVV